MNRTCFSVIRALGIALPICCAALASADAQSLTVLHAFTGGTDGVEPFGELLEDQSGNLYGTTEIGGGTDCGGLGCGSVFIVASDDTEKVAYGFQGGADGDVPLAGLIADGNGNLYGTTTHGGGTKCGLHHAGCGTIFQLAPDGTESVLYAFAGGRDGKDPEASLFMDQSGNLYGTTREGGHKKCPASNEGCGTVFELAPDGTKTILHSFRSDKDGSFPSGMVVADQSGNLYGTTEWGGSESCGTGIGCGTVFEISGAGKETLLYRFKGGSDGVAPSPGLIMDSAGNLYGTTSEGGNSACGGSGCGTVFKVSPDGHERILHTFIGENDGANPYGRLTMDADGNLFGTTTRGGGGNCTNGCGTVFELTGETTEQVLYAFSGGNDGLFPTAGITLDDAGKIFGTTLSGGDLNCDDGEGCGVVFELTK